ncbi:MAG: fimbria/pilus periplasmic chaperone [Spirochaetes bacterium]|jgi:fimbrial chaperone protein|nr:fimbria/pilus periplasmic chaperone [Spirochaetota bacterium]
MRRILGIILLSLASVSAYAFDFRPITQDFAPEGANAMRTFRVTNTGSEDIAVRISMFSRALEEDGSEVRNEVDDQFVVFPSRIVVEPGNSQVIRVQWRGGPVQREQAYRIVAEQLPVDFNAEESEGSNLNILFRYVGSVYVVPGDAEPNVEVQSARISETKDGPVLTMRITNNGTAHTILQDLTVTVRSDGGNQTTLVPEDLPNLAGSNLLAGSAVRARVPLSGSWQEGAVNVDLDFDATR